MIEIALWGNGAIFIKSCLVQIKWQKALKAFFCFSQVHTILSHHTQALNIPTRYIINRKLEMKKYEKVLTFLTFIF